MRGGILSGVTMALLLCCMEAHAQSRFAGDPDSTSDLEEEEGVPDGEEFFDQVFTEPEQSELVDKLLWLREHPFDLNRVTKEELETIPGVSPGDAAAVIDFRTRFKGLNSIRLIETVGEDVLGRLMPYIFIDREKLPGSSADRTVLRIRSRTTRDLQSRAGYQNGAFGGSSLHVYNRITLLASGSLEAGGMFEKDAGERYTDGSASGYVVAKDLPFASQLIAGDFVVEAGQGLVFWRASAFGKGANAIGTAKRSGPGPQPHRSGDEFNFFRGVAATTTFLSSIGEFRISGLYSRHALSAYADDSQSVSSFNTTGLFRTAGELRSRNVETERIVGGMARYKPTEDLAFGATYYHSTFEKPVVADRTFEFSGRHSDVAGIDADVQLERIALFGEIARTRAGAMAGIGGAVLKVGRKASVAIAYRDYSPRFNNIHANGFGEGGNTRNERGLYIGVQIPWSNWLKINAYIDQYKNPWRTYDAPLPVSGNDLLIQVDAMVLPELELSARYTNKTTENAGSAFDELSRSLRPLFDRRQRRFRCTATHDVTKRLQIKGRIEATGVTYGVLERHEQGYLFLHDIRYVASKNLSIQIRLVFFDTDSYDSRLYEYESDLRGAFSNPALYGRGRRWYALVHYRCVDAVGLSVKYSETEKEGVTSLGSGPSEIIGDMDNRIAIQVDFQW